MAVFNLKEGDLGDREKLLEAEDPRQKAEKLGVKMEELQPRELKQYLFRHYIETGFEAPEIKVMLGRALQHFLPALRDREHRVLYRELEK